MKKVADLSSATFGTFGVKSTFTVTFAAKSDTQRVVGDADPYKTAMHLQDIRDADPYKKCAKHHLLWS